jgi:DNA anti-recombination protein RmuC
MDPIFEWGVGIASWVIVLLFVVQVVIWFLLYRIVQKVMAMVEELRGKYEPKVDQVFVSVGDVQKTVTTVSETVGTVSTEVRAVSAAVTASAERISVVATESAEEIRETVRSASAEIKALVTNTSSEVQGLVKTTSHDVQTIVQTSKETTHGAAARMDLMVERTARRVEETGAYVQSQVLDPVREVSAIVKGIKVALETLLGYPERKQIDQAYSEEELFI